MNKAIRTTIQLSGIELEVFRVANNGNDSDYVMSQSQVAHAIETYEKSVRQFLGQKQLEGKLGNGYTLVISTEIEPNKQGKRGQSRIKPMPINLASEFWTEQAFKGNKLAQSLVFACVQEALKRRCDNAFDVAKSTEQYEEESITDRKTWIESRSFLKDAHASFTNCCLYNGFNAAIAHDEITKQVCGKTAKELRFEELVNGDFRVGLNHVSDSNELAEIAKVKLAFSRYKVGTVKQRVKRALEEVLTRNN